MAGGGSGQQRSPAICWQAANRSMLPGNRSRKWAMQDRRLQAGMKRRAQRGRGWQQAAAGGATRRPRTSAARPILRAHHREQHQQRSWEIALRQESEPAARHRAARTCPSLLACRRCQQASGIWATSQQSGQAQLGLHTLERGGDRLAAKVRAPPRRLAGKTWHRGRARPNWEALQRAQPVGSRRPSARAFLQEPGPACAAAH